MKTTRTTKATRMMKTPTKTTTARSCSDLQTAAP
jgi:hypothetical protein